MNGNITALLIGWSNGNEEILKELMPLVYKELQTLARHHLAKEGPDQNLITGDLVNELYLCLVPRHTTNHWFQQIARSSHRPKTSLFETPTYHQKGTQSPHLAIPREKLQLL